MSLPPVLVFVLWWRPGDLQQHTLDFVLGVQTASGFSAQGVTHRGEGGRTQCQGVDFTVLIPLGLFRKLAGMPMAECGMNMADGRVWHEHEV